MKRCEGQIEELSLEAVDETNGDVNKFHSIQCDPSNTCTLKHTRRKMMLGMDK